MLLTKKGRLAENLLIVLLVAIMATVSSILIVVITAFDKGGYFWLGMLFLAFWSFFISVLISVFYFAIAAFDIYPNYSSINKYLAIIMFVLLMSSWVFNMDILMGLALYVYWLFINFFLLEKFVSRPHLRS